MANWGRSESRLLDFLGEEGWPVGVGQSPDYLTFLVRKVGQLVGRRVSRLLDFLGEEGWPIGVGQSPDYLTFLMRKNGQLVGKASVRTT